VRNDLCARHRQDLAHELAEHAPLFHRNAITMPLRRLRKLNAAAPSPG
jgi:hypothetical protein